MTSASVAAAMTIGRVPAATRDRPTGPDWTTLGVGASEHPRDRFYHTDFAGSEEPLSESGAWVTGGVVGRQWKDPRKSNGRAFGTQSVHSAPPYDDSIAHLRGFPPSQSARAAIFADHPVGGLEVELLLRFEIRPNHARGYEIDLYRGGGSLSVVRWNGPLNDFTYLAQGVKTNASFEDGDVWYAEMVGTVITVACNERQVWRSDRRADPIVWLDGNPGIGFFTGNTLGKPSANSSFGWRNFSARAL